MESESRELVPGIFIHKSYISSSSIPDAIGTYIWNIEVKTMSVITLNLSFENSENIQIENNNNSEISIIINPYENKQIVKITLFQDWILNPKFQLKLNVPSKEIQENFIKNDKIINNQNLKKCFDNFKYIQLENFQINEIEKLFLEKKIDKFVDYDFQPNDLSMISKKFSKDGTEIKDILDYIIDWRRPESFILLNDEKNEVYNIINDNPEPNDIIQEILPDHNFSSSISCISEKPNLIKRLINNKKISKFGFYIINLCINGLWKKIFIDDLFPCIPKSNPMITHSPSNEIWILLLEKALAKIFDSY